MQLKPVKSIRFALPSVSDISQYEITVNKKLLNLLIKERFPQRLYTFFTAYFHYCTVGLSVVLE